MFAGPATRKISRFQPQHPRGTDTIPVRRWTLQNCVRDIFSSKTETFADLVIQPGAVCETHLQGRGSDNPVRARAEHAHHGDEVVPEQRLKDKSRGVLFLISKFRPFVGCGKGGMIRWQLLESDILNEKIFLTEIRVSQRRSGILEYLQNLNTAIITGLRNDMTRLSWSRSGKLRRFSPERSDARDPGP